ERTTKKPWPEVAHSLIQLALFAVLLWGIYYTGWSHTPNDLYTALPMMALIFVLASDRGALARVLSTKPMLRLGEYSYGIYMGQTALLQLIRVIEQHYPPPGAMVLGRRFADWAGILGWVEALSLLTLAVLWGALLTICVERPAASRIKRFFHDGHRLKAA
ncbi:MAG: hypothetical protein KGL69_07540, partial [Alphaproteobacteria bacterium]|nr:hypothetical protein [Alphaproteobacteria bacterium]